MGIHLAMSETSGLSRRRVNTGPASTTSSEPSSSFPSHAGSAFAGGNKIAFDPRDIKRDEEESKAGGKIPRLTLMEEVLLLGFERPSGKFYLSNFGHLTRLECRVTCHSGMTTSPTRCVAVFSSNSPSGGASPFTTTLIVVDSPSPTVWLKSSTTVRRGDHP
jgi:hypothetical protein